MWHECAGGRRSPGNYLATHKDDCPRDLLALQKSAFFGVKYIVQASIDSMTRKNASNYALSTRDSRGSLSGQEQTPIDCPGYWQSAAPVDHSIPRCPPRKACISDFDGVEFPSVASLPSNNVGLKPHVKHICIEAQIMLATTEFL
jgi:hypothetical protein